MSAEFFSTKGSPTSEKEAFVDKLVLADLPYDSFCEIVNRPFVKNGLIAELVNWLNESIWDDRRQERRLRTNNASGRLDLSPENKVMDEFEKLLGCRVTLWLVEGGMEFVHQLIGLTMHTVNATEELSYLDRGDWYRVQELLVLAGLLDAKAVWPIGRDDK